MSDGASTDMDRGLGQADLPPAKPVLTITGYCAECGTWDTHGLVCSSCGFDFGGTPTDDIRSP